MIKKILSVILAVFCLTVTVGAAGITVREVASGLEYWNVGSFYNGLAYAHKDNKYGFIDKTGNEVIPCIYDGIWYFSDELMVVRTRDSENNLKFGFIDRAGELVVPYVYEDEIHLSEEGMARVARDGKWGFVNKMGQLVSPCVYDNVEDFIGGTARVETNGKWNYIDKLGNVLITFEYDEVGDFSDDMAWIRKNGKYGYIDKTGELVLPMIYDVYTDEWENIKNLAHDFSEGLAAVRIDGKCGFINKKGELVIPAIYDGNFYSGEWGAYVPTFHDGLARVKMDGFGWDGTWGCINKKGEVVIPFEYSKIGNNWTGHFYEGIAAIYSKDGAGLIDKNGTFITYEYDYVTDFNGTLAYVEIAEQEYGAYIDKTGKVVTPFEYYADQWLWAIYDPSVDGMTIAYNKKLGKYVKLDSRGNIVEPFEYDDYYVYSDNFSNGLARVWKDGKCGYIDEAGELVISLIYDSATDFNEGLSAVLKDGKWAILEIVDYTPIGKSPKTGDNPVILICFVAIVFVIIIFRRKSLCRI
jgi:hypothetical protein